MADVISSLKLGDTNYQIKDREAADTRITEEEIVALLKTNYVATKHDDHTSQPEGGSN